MKPAPHPLRGPNENATGRGPGARLQEPSRFLRQPRAELVGDQPMRATAAARLGGGPRAPDDGVVRRTLKRVVHPTNAVPKERREAIGQQIHLPKQRVGVGADVNRVLVDAYEPTDGVGKTVEPPTRKGDGLHRGTHIAAFRYTQIMPDLPLFAGRRVRIAHRLLKDWNDLLSLKRQRNPRTRRIPGMPKRVFRPYHRVHPEQRISPAPFHQPNLRLLAFILQPRKHLYPKTNVVVVVTRHAVRWK